MALLLLAGGEDRHYAGERRVERAHRVTEARRDVDTGDEFSMALKPSTIATTGSAHFIT
jgi:hypothetical protein